MFAHSLDLLTDVSIELEDRAVGEEACYIRWIYRYRTKKGGKPWRIEGMTELRFAEDGRVAAHVDHWDAAGQVYEKLPVLGGGPAGDQAQAAALSPCRRPWDRGLSDAPLPMLDRSPRRAHPSGLCAAI